MPNVLTVMTWAKIIPAVKPIAVPENVIGGITGHVLPIISVEQLNLRHVVIASRGFIVMRIRRGIIAIAFRG